MKRHEEEGLETEAALPEAVAHLAALGHTIAQQPLG